MSWLPRLRRDPVAPLERAILDNVRQHLSPEAQAIWDQQISAIVLSQCILGREVNYYIGRHTSVPEFPHIEQEVNRLATVSFEYGSVAYKARVYLVNGRVFSIEFNRDVRSVRKRRDIRVISVTLHTNPMQLSPRIPQPESIALAQVQPKGWLAEWIEHYPIDIMLAAVSPEERKQALQHRGLQNLPEDYKELLEQCDGFAGGDYTVFGVSGMYEVSLGEDVYWVLAERGGGFLMAHEGDCEARVYFVHHEEAAPSQVFCTFRGALEYLLCRPDLP